MALDSFFHNKIESMKLEIIQGQAVLRRLEAQRNDYNSRGTGPEAVPTRVLLIGLQCAFSEKSWDYYSNLDLTLAKL